jgi:hypothetical protein
LTRASRQPGAWHGSVVSLFIGRFSLGSPSHTSCRAFERHAYAPDGNGVIAITPGEDLDSFFAIGCTVVDEAPGDPTASLVVTRRAREG